MRRIQLLSRPPKRPTPPPLDLRTRPRTSAALLPRSRPAGWLRAAGRPGRPRRSRPVATRSWTAHARQAASTALFHSPDRTDHVRRSMIRHALLAAAKPIAAEHNRQVRLALSGRVSWWRRVKARRQQHIHAATDDSTLRCALVVRGRSCGIGPGKVPHHKVELMGLQPLTFSLRGLRLVVSRACSGRFSVHSVHPDHGRNVPGAHGRIDSWPLR